jgi:hypothetical protein
MFQHPDLTAALAAEHRGDLQRQAAHARLLREAHRTRDAARPSRTPHTAPARLPRLAVARLWRRRTTASA